VGRKNRKGRGAKHNPQRFYREKRQGGRDGGNSDAVADFDRAGTDAWSARARRKRRRRSGAVDAVESMMESALRHDQRELVRDQPPQEPGPLWLIDAADVKSLPHPSGRNPNDPPRNAVRAAICGNCREWIQPGDPLAGARGRCLHPASGVSYPPSEFEACAFFA
jgi:hypothetical protein